MELEANVTNGNPFIFNNVERTGIAGEPQFLVSVVFGI